MFSRSRSVVGLDIGSSAVKLVELKERKGGEYQLLKLGIEALSPEAIVDGSIMDSALVVDAIDKLGRETGAKGGQYATSLSGHSVIIKKIQVPAMDEEELTESLQWEAEQYIPFDINDVRLDYVVLDTEAGPGEMEVLLVAVKREKVNDYVSVITQSGRSAALVDVDAFAVQNAFEANYDLPLDRVVALINMGSSVTNINVLSHGGTVFWRDLSFGGTQFTEALQREFGLSYDQAEALKRGESVDGRTPEEARTVLDAISMEMGAEIEKTFEFFAATSAEGPVDELVLSGGCSLTPNLQQVLQDRFGIPTELMNPLRNVDVRGSGFDESWLKAVAPTLAVAVGLAIRKVGD